MLFLMGSKYNLKTQVWLFFSSGKYYGLKQNTRLLCILFFVLQYYFIAAVLETLIEFDVTTPLDKFKTTYIWGHV